MLTDAFGTLVKDTTSVPEAPVSMTQTISHEKR